MRTFVLHRENDVTGVSGIGDIAEGVEFSDGTVVLRWGPNPQRNVMKSSVAVWTDVDSMIAIHGHDGATRVVWD